MGVVCVVSVEKTANHLLIHCTFTHKVWSSIITMFDMSWVMPVNVMELFLQWKYSGSSARGCLLWCFSLYAGLWKLWLERNSRIFKNKSKSFVQIVQSIIWNILEWASKKAEFEGVALEDLNRSWAANLVGGYHPRSVHRIRWIPPLAGFLNLNFDGSYIKQINLGGVIRDSFGSVVKNFLVHRACRILMVLKLILYWLVGVSFVSWKVTTQLLKVTRSLLSSGVQENLLFHGGWQIWWRRCKIFRHN
eukprot:TRINITY_DN12355_c3_g1_i1.p1 TRINITY_DN12355_c3_g1~~TRINITY_DN12355_c3_g1_i1.p1  ORF type:complete len:248 (+),score=21.79 TRINITY_DN12355_c3_g1_i1:391-1134(+)